MNEKWFYLSQAIMKIGMVAAIVFAVAWAVRGCAPYMNELPSGG